MIEFLNSFKKMPTIIAIIGPTATGKTDFAVKIATKLNTEIISADSMQIYREINICNAKPSKEILKKIRHHLISDISVVEDYSVFKFVKKAQKIINYFYKNEKPVVISGGTGLYVDALLKNYKFKKNSENKADIYDKKIEKNEYNVFKIGLNFKERRLLYEKVNNRVDDMIKNGLVEEIDFIMNNYRISVTARSMIGIKEIMQYLNKEITLREAVDKIKMNTRRYAKRQITWFKRDSNINWFFVN